MSVNAPSRLRRCSVATLPGPTGNEGETKPEAGLARPARRGPDRHLPPHRDEEAARRRARLGGGLRRDDGPVGLAHRGHREGELAARPGRAVGDDRVGPGEGGATLVELQRTAGIGGPAGQDAADREAVAAEDVARRERERDLGGRRLGAGGRHEREREHDRARRHGDPRACAVHGPTFCAMRRRAALRVARSGGVSRRAGSACGAWCCRLRRPR
jgi:hypothetical protein